ncbi:toll/interleukin-1 receptor domain-containing protein [Psychromonas aquimarina]|uniref:toll/interleukin-1 receptor domain-containing protein n=1 Tax=Psychromonas aquimarina TaxID=444919 RepID=UPI0012F77504|nr:toll/interleukin-1 receptor domain-containing protein [Psychromonas aquimarina]
MISTSEKIRLLKKLLDKADLVTIENSSDPEFKSWKNLVERTFVKVFGESSTEYKHFSELRFFFQALMWTTDSDFTADHLRVFRQDFGILKSSITQYIEEFEEQEQHETPVIKKQSKLKTKASKVFISHASKDSAIVEEVIELLESIGLESHQIFCTSFDGYGIGLGENFLDKIKDELSSDTIVLFILSNNFYSSPVCLCEMGATWVLAKEHIPIVIPPLDYSDISGVIPLTQGMKINEPLKLNLLKEKIENEFNLNNSGSLSTWERKRDRVLLRISKLIAVES